MLQCTKCLIVVVGFKKSNIFTFSPIVKMNANDAKICWVDNFEADFQKILLVHLKFSQ